MKRDLKNLLMILFVCALAPIATAQVTVNNNFQPSVGTSVDFWIVNGLDSASFEAAGSGVGAQNWDFSAFTKGTMFSNLVIDPATAPLIDSFPEANQVFRFSFNDQITWSFNQSTPDVHQNWGYVFDMFGTDTTFKVYNKPSTRYHFPINYNDSWQESNLLYISISPDIINQISDSAFFSVDAYGTASYGGNSLPCLRIRVIEKTTTISLMNSTPIFYDTLINERLEFVSDGYEAQCILSKSTNTGLDFYSASASAAFFDDPTDVRERETGLLPDGFELAQNYPNPFNPSTEIQFSLPTASQVKLIIYNTLGQETKRLVDRRLSAGAYTADWNGTDNAGNQVASGIYLYRLESGGLSISKKMQLIK